ncbi:MAG: hypothetical protein JWR80_6362 [Bradyrhizobium sp.]|nr:hypothetical protein [Bradyrhizobium sp.]
MTALFVVKWIHILSSTFLFGTGIGSAFYMLTVSLTRDWRAIALVARYVVIADWLFTTPAIVVQPLSGLFLARLVGYPLGSSWILWSFLLYLLAGACWLPVVWLQIRMRKLAERAQTVPEAALQFDRCLKWWIVLGVPAFVALVAVFYLMVAKPH